MLKGKAILWKIVYFCIVCQFTKAHKEHKVHNIVLYPDKHSWCITTPIKQVVTYPGCNAIEIDNNICVGACFSYSIPHIDPSDPSEVIKPYCDSCQPSETTWRHVKLECNTDEIDVSEMQKYVQIIKNCSCNSCNADDDSTQITPIISSGDGEIDRKPVFMDVQELIDHMVGREKEAQVDISNNTGLKNLAGNKKILKLLALFGGKDSSYYEKADVAPDVENSIEDTKSDAQVLRELIKQSVGPEHAINKETLGQFVRNVEDHEHIKLSIDKLQHVLEGFETNITENENDNHSFVLHKHHSRVRNHHNTKHSNGNHGRHHGQTEDKNNHGSTSDDNVYNTTPTENMNYSISTNDNVKSHDSSQNMDNIQIQDVKGSYIDNDNNIVLNRQEEINITLDALEHHFKPAIEGEEISYSGNIPTLTVNGESFSEL